MKSIFTCFFLFLCSLFASAQVVDTLLFENFQADSFGIWGTVPFGDDASWVTFDEDGLTPYDNDENHRAWYFSQFFYQAEDTLTGEVNYCAASLSYMEGFANGNRNWLITPPLQIDNANYTLHWKSAPFQLPRYMDGYLVLAAEGSNDIFNGVFSDTLFQAASMASITGNGQSVLLNNFTFTPGYIHADNLTNDDYVDLWAEGDSSLMRGILEPHSVSLSAYAGKKIYLAFLHNSDDDYFLALDDVLVASTTVSAVNNPSTHDFRFVTYPNPVTNYLNVMYRLSEATQVGVQITDMSGKVIFSVAPESQPSGEHQMNLELSKLPTGSYSLSLLVGNEILTKVFVKK